MDLSYSESELAFQDEVRSFFAQNLPAGLSGRIKAGKRLGREDYVTWHELLNSQGWLASSWPKEFGGTGWGPVEKHIFDMECALAHAPRIVPFGLTMLGPVLIKYGSQAQKDYWLPRILDGSDWWCQGYSEPGAGSDLAALKTSAVRDGDHYIVNGQKTWTTMGQHANMIFTLVRTDPDAPKRQMGISFLLIDMDQPGVEVRPIITLDGEHEINEVWFSDAKVPVENLVGEENMGWTYAKYLLSHERTNLANVGLTTVALEGLKRIVATQEGLAEDPHFAARMAKVEIELEALSTTNLKMIADAASTGAPGAEASILKILGSQIRQEITDLSRRAIGPFALPFIPEALEEGYNEEPIGPEGAAGLAPGYFNHRKYSIFGGSNEIQKGIFAKAGLGL